VVAYPLVALSVRADAGENVKASFKPIVPTLSDFDGFVLLMIRGIGAIGGGFAAIGREVAVQLNHGVARRHGFRAIDLHFVIPLREHSSAAKAKGRQDASESQDLILLEGFIGGSVGRTRTTAFGLTGIKIVPVQNRVKGQKEGALCLPAPEGTQREEDDVPLA